MSLESNTPTIEQHLSNQTLSPREFLLRYLPYVPWIILSLFVCLLFSYIKLRYEPKIYSVSSTLMVKDPSDQTDGKDKIEAILFNSSNKNIFDEIQVIQTNKMGVRVASSLGLELMYYNNGNFLTSLLSPVTSPIGMQVVNIQDSSRPFSLSVKVLNDSSFRVGDKTETIRFGQTFSTAEGSFILRRRPISMEKFPIPEFMITYAPTYSRGEELVSRLSVIPLGESNNIMRLTFETEAPELGVEVLNQWMKEYEISGFDEKKQSAMNALSFINEQLNSANSELGAVELSLLSFRQKNMVIDPLTQSQSLITSIQELEKEITTKAVELRLVDNLIEYISDTRNPYRQVGTLLNLNEPTLVYQIQEFNKFQVERATMLLTTPRTNPMMVTVETAIEKLRQDILQNLKNIRKGFQVLLDDLNTQNAKSNSIISRLPAKEKEMLDITRRQKIQEELYQFLLEKKLETAIASASTISNVKVLEPAKASYIPIRPNRKGAYIFALLIGLGIPLFVAFLIEYLNDRIRSRTDVTRATRAPIIGEVGHSEFETTLIVNQSSRNFISEQFKIIRTNLQYIVPEKQKSVLLVTSSTSGEGKSFITTNLAAVIAMSGRKTAILEFDIRKPKIMSGLHLPKAKGVTNYIIGGVAFEDLMVKVPGVDNLDVIPCGPIPPNPSELLLDQRLNDMIVKLKEIYDVIVIDTAPVGLVSDAMVIGKHADVSIYLIRHDYTFKKQMQMMDEIYSSKRLPRLCIVLNDIRGKAGVYGGYYGYGGYGYGSYGSSYGKDYFEEARKARKYNPFATIKSWFQS